MKDYTFPIDMSVSFLQTFSTLRLKCHLYLLKSNLQIFIIIIKPGNHFVQAQIKTIFINFIMKD